MNISIIIPNYNGEKLLEKNLKYVFIAALSYKKKKNANIEIIVIDDASTDNSKKVLEELKKQEKNLPFSILINGYNCGFSSTINKGVKNAKGEILVLLNTDVLPQEDFLFPLIKNFENKDVFAVGCMDKSIENGKIIFRGRGVGRWKKGFLYHAAGNLDKINTLWASGGSSAFRRSIWVKLGGLNEIYNPFYWEDIDISYRALKSGYKILFESKSIVIHEHEKGSIKQKYSPFQIKTIAYRNQFIFIWENITDLDLQFLHILWLPYHFFSAFVRGDWAFFLGFFEAFIKLPEIIRSSFHAQELFIKKDKEIIQEFTQ